MSDLNGPKKETVRITLPPRVPPGGGGGASGTSKVNPVGAPSAVAGAEPSRRVLPPPPPPSRRLPPPPLAQLPPAASSPPPPPAVLPPLVAVPPPSATAPLAPPPTAPVPPPPAMPPRPRVLPPPPRVIPPRPLTGNVTDAPGNYPGSGSMAGPRKETARITIRPEPVNPMTATVKMAKTQPLLTVPVVPLVSAPVRVTTTAEAEPSPGMLDMLDRVPLPICWILCGISAITLLIQIWNYFAA